MKSQTLKESIDSYGVAVRAGSITPQKDDEVFIRNMMGVPPMSESVERAWDNDEGVRRPTTLKAGDTLDAEQGNIAEEGEGDSDGQQDD